jgi:hypothetical protein
MNGWITAVKRVSVWAAAVLLLGGAAVGCGGTPGEVGKAGAAGGEGAALKPDSKVVASDDDHTVLELSDGRQVSLAFAAGRGVEAKQRESADAEWSSAVLVHANGQAPCQGITAKAYRDTVWLTAGFGMYCRDGDEPNEVIAAVGTSDLTSWNTDVAKDGTAWPKSRVRDGGTRVDFVDRN